MRVAGGRSPAQEADQDPARAAGEVPHVGTWLPGRCTQTVDLLMLGSEPGQGQGLELAKLAEFSVLAGEAPGRARRYGPSAG